MTALPDLLRDLAEDSRDYSDPDRVVAAARHRRTARLAAASIAAAAVGVVVGAFAFLPVSGGDHRTVTPGPTPEYTELPPEVRSIYPPIVAAQPGAPQLPFETAVGPAALFYSPCAQIATADCWPNLVLPNGSQYAVPMTVDSGLPRDLTLSPNGRYAGWGYELDGWFHVRDLTTGVTRQFGQGQPQTSPWFWSPDSRWLLLAEHTGSTVSRLLLADMNGGEQELPDRLEGTPIGTAPVVGLLDSGELLVGAATTYDGWPTLAVIDPTNGREVRRVQATPPSGISGELPARGEFVIWYLVSPCSCAVQLVLNGPDHLPWNTGLLGMDLGDGHIFGRLDLPDSAVSTGIDPGVWFVPVDLPGGIVLVHSYPGGTDVEILNSVNGSRAVVSRLPPDSYVIVRGQTR